MIDQGIALIPMADLERVDTWFVAGMKSSGSICLKANDVFVPAPPHHVGAPRHRGRLPDGNAQPGGVLSLRLRSVLSIILVGPILGLGRAALDFVRQKAVADHRLYVL